MTQLNLNLPVIGQTNATEDPKVRTALSDIQTVVNALDNTNIASAADINGSKLLDSSIATAKLANDAVTAAKIANDAVGSSEIAASAVGTSEIADGAVTNAKIANGAISLPRVKVTRTANQEATNGATLTITFPDEAVDTDAFHSTTSNTSRITIPSGLGGDYVVMGSVTCAANGSGKRALWITKNGTLQNGSADLVNSGANAEFRITVTNLLVGLVATDYLELNFFQNSGTNLNVTDATFSTYRIG